jgi:DNA-binding XRE family transcriptional regulator
MLSKKIDNRKMAGRETEQLINQLKAWAAEERGRQSEIARILGVSRQSVSEWFSGKAVPNWETGLKIQAFLKTRSPK